MIDMPYTYNVFTNNFDYYEELPDDVNVDGGAAASTYLVTQSINGGNASG